MSPDPYTARLALVTTAKRLREVVDFVVDRHGGGHGRGLDRAQRLYLLRSFREDLSDQVDDAEHRGITEKGAALLSLTRSMIRWLERGELPGPGAIPLLERILASITRNPDAHELTEREALVAAIHDLGGDETAAAELWREPTEEYPEALAAYGRTLHRLMRRTGLSVAELADRAALEPSAVVALICGTEEATISETLTLAGALGVLPQALFEDMESEVRGGAGGLPTGGLNPGGPRDAEGRVDPGPADAARSCGEVEGDDL